MSIVEFLLARIGEDEAVARAAAYEPDPDYPVESDNPWGRCGEFAGRGGDMFRHILRHDPARVLAGCAAKRAIVAAAVAWGPPRDHTLDEIGIQTEYAEILGHLAAVYADHPDYRQEWA